MAIYYSDLDIPGTGGDGSPGNPFRLGDTFNAPEVNPATRSTAGNALAGPGDRLRIRGTGLIATSSAGTAYQYPALRPAGNGTALAPIVIEGYPDETPRLVRTGGTQGIVGTFQTDYCTIRGIEAVADSGTKNGLIHHSSLENRLPTRAIGNAVISCLVIGEDLPLESDNHDGIRIDCQESWLVDLCEVRGLTGYSGNNSAGLKTYFSRLGTCKRSYFHDNNCNIHNKVRNQSLAVADSANTYSELYLDTPRNACMQASDGGHVIRDSLIVGMISLHWMAQDLTIRNNLFVQTRKPTEPRVWGSRDDSQAAPADAYRGTFHSNLILGGAAIRAVSTANQPLGTVGSETCFLKEADHNLFVRGDGSLLAPAVTWQFGEYATPPDNRTLAQMQSATLESGSQVLAGGLDELFSDPATYTLAAGYLAAGRDGAMPGPADMAGLLDLSRYGPDGASGGGEPPADVPAALLLRLPTGNVLALRVG